MRRVLVLAAAGLAVACHGARGPADPRAAKPTQIEARCVLLADKALCSFDNQGRTGALCVRVAYGSASVAPASAAADTCSGRLAPGDVATVEVLFPSPPSTACGDDAGSCTVRAFEPKAARAQIDVWRDELADAGKALTASDEECGKVIDHLIDVTYAQQTRDASPEEKQQADEWKAQAQGDGRADLITQCKGEVKSGKVACMLAADTVDKMNACEKLPAQ